MENMFFIHAIHDPYMGWKKKKPEVYQSHSRAIINFPSTIYILETLETVFNNVPFLHF